MRGLKVEDNFNDPNIVRVNADGSKFENSTKKNEPADVKAGTSTSSTTKTATQTTVSAYPTTMNWKTSGIVTPVRDQGDCGSCWAFATVAMFESEAVRIKGRSVTSLNLAEQFLLKCDRNNYGCNGGNCISSSSLVLSKGLPLESTYLYDPAQNYRGICKATPALTFTGSKLVYYAGAKLTDN